VTVARFVALVRLDDGALGLRMEMARGRSWGALVDEENLRRDDPPDIYRAIRATRKLLGQLRRVHSIREPGAPSGFVHSDIKPTNVFVEDADPSDPSVTLLDFGVATAGRAAFDDEAALLGRETFVLRQTGGTPGYAPPGHFNARPSPASDVHAAMVCFYELVALSLPWDIDELEPSPAGFALLELRVSSPPRPVRAMRAAIPADEAKVLDRFFASAFAELQSRSLAWSSVASARDESSQERARVMVDELSTLAGEYQRSLDALSRELESLGIAAPPAPPPSLILTPAAPPSIVVDEPASAIDTAPTMVAARKVDRGRSAWADTESDAPIALPLERRPWRLWALSALGLCALALAAVSVRSALRPSNATRALDAGGVRDADLAADALDDRPALALDPGVSLAVAPTVPLDVRALPRAFRSARAVAAMSTPALVRDAGRDSSASGPSATVLCVASARGVRVVARGGALDHEVELCSTDVLSDPSTQEFAGRAEMDAEVLRALPTVLCVGDGRWLTTVRRFSATSGAQTWLFTCSRPAPEPAVALPLDASVSPSAAPSVEQDAANVSTPAPSEADAASASSPAQSEQDAASVQPERDAQPASPASDPAPEPRPTPERDASASPAPEPRPASAPADAQP
jgi:hypothetical protein